VVTARMGSANPRLGLQPRESMPLLMYFATVGGILTTLLLLFNFMLEPGKPESSKHAATDVETSLRKPRTTTGFMPSTVGVAAKAPAAEARRDSAEITGSSAQPANQQASRVVAERKSVTKAKPKSARQATGRRPYRDSGYSSYAQRLPKWRSSAAEGTLGPH
jgi:hypothetical protein